MSSVIENGFYIRYHGEHRDRAENEIRRLYDEIPYRVILTSSGMNSIFIVMFSFIQYAKAELGCKDPILLMADELYCDTEEEICDYLRINGIVIRNFDQTNAESVKELVEECGENICGIYFETCSNPHGKISDFTFLSLLGEKCRKIVDNTWLSPIIFNPFKYSVDVVVESCTKYLSGSSQILGHICLKEENVFSRIVDNNAYMMGTHVAPIVCMGFYSSLNNVRERIYSSIERTRLLMRKFEENFPPSLKKIYWSGFGHDEYASSVVLFEVLIGNSVVKNGEEFEMMHYCEDVVKMTHIAWETSYGKKYDAICNWIKKTSDNILLRLSLGHRVGDDDRLSSVNKLYDDMVYIIGRM